MPINRILLFLFIVLCFKGQIYGQTLKEAKQALKKLKQIEDADSLKQLHPSWQMFVNWELLMDSSSNPDLTNKKPGDIIVRDHGDFEPKFIIKVFGFENQELCKVRYIYLDGHVYSPTQIDSLRNLIIHKYKTGESFDSLVSHFSMDGNPTGDLPWFGKGTMVQEFYDGVLSYKPGDLFTVDVPPKLWYYVVLKTDENRVEPSLITLHVLYH